MYQTAQMETASRFWHPPRATFALGTGQLPTTVFVERLQDFPSDNFWARYLVNQKTSTPNFGLAKLSLIINEGRIDRQSHELSQVGQRQPAKRVLRRRSGESVPTFSVPRKQIPMRSHEASPRFCSRFRCRWLRVSSSDASNFFLFFRKQTPLREALGRLDIARGLMFIRAWADGEPVRQTD